MEIKVLHPVGPRGKKNSVCVSSYAPHWKHLGSGKWQMKEFVQSLFSSGVNTIDAHIIKYYLPIAQMAICLAFLHIQTSDRFQRFLENSSFCCSFTWQLRSTLQCWTFMSLLNLHACWDPAVTWETTIAHWQQDGHVLKLWVILFNKIQWHF